MKWQGQLQAQSISADSKPSSLHDIYGAITTGEVNIDSLQGDESAYPEEMVESMIRCSAGAATTHSANPLSSKSMKKAQTMDKSPFAGVEMTNLGAASRDSSSGVLRPGMQRGASTQLRDLKRQVRHSEGQRMSSSEQVKVGWRPPTTHAASKRLARDEMLHHSESSMHTASSCETKSNERHAKN